MNHEMAAPDLFLAAARLVERGLNQLNVGETPCDTCGARHFTNKAEARIWESLATLPQKLRNGAAKLGRVEGDRGAAALRITLDDDGTVDGARET